MKQRIIFVNIIFFSILLGDGGYDFALSAGKKNLDLSLTINPYNYFDEGQSYLIVGYGLTNNIDLQFYYSSSHNKSDNYYTGLLYQFYNGKKLGLSTALGIRKFSELNDINYFFPQFLYSFKVTNKFFIAGSTVDVRNENLSIDGRSIDIFFKYNFYTNKKFKIFFTTGLFKPALWKPKNYDFHPTYSFDIKFFF